MTTAYVDTTQTTAPSPASHWSRETYIALLAMFGILIHLIARFGWHTAAPQYSVPLIVVLTIGGTPLLLALLRRMLGREFGSDLLAGLSIVASVLLGEYLVGSIIVLML